MKPTPALRSRRSHTLVTVWLAVLTCLASGAAWAQWQWKDASGRPVFSDSPPPTSVAEKDILKRPATRAPAVATPEPASPPNTPAASVTKPAVVTGADPQLEEKKKQLEKAEADKRKAETQAADDKMAKVRAANCDTARKGLASLDSGARLTTTNAKGETEYLDEAGRQAQRRRTEALIRDNCR